MHSKDFNKKLTVASLFDLNELLRKAVSLVEYQLRVKEIRLTFAYSDEPLLINANYLSLLRGCIYIFLDIMRVSEISGSKKCINLSIHKVGEKAVLEINDTFLFPLEGQEDAERIVTVQNKMNDYGLSYALKLIREEGGQISFKHGSEGRRFRIELPLDPLSMVKSKETLRVLVLDDDKTALDILNEYLCMLGCKVQLVSSPLDALSLLRHNPYDIVIVDLRMPEMDGIDFVKRASKFISRDRFILLIGDAYLKKLDSFGDSDKIKVINKPLRFVDLRQAISLFTERET